MLENCKNCDERGLKINGTKGNIVCRYCGMLLRFIDENSEVQNLAKDSPTLVEEVNNDLMQESGLRTETSPTKNKVAALSRSTERSTQITAEYTLRGFHKIDEISLSMALQNTIIEEAKNIFKEIIETKSLKGKSHNAIIGSCIFLACRKNSNSRAIKEISLQLKVDKNEIVHCYSMIKKDIPMRHCTDSVAEYAKQYANKLGMNEIEILYSQKLAERVNELEIVTGKNPLTVASAAVYMVGILSGNKKTYSQISGISSIRSITIRKCFKDLINSYDRLLDELPNEWKKENLNR